MRVSIRSQLLGLVALAYIYSPPVLAGHTQPGAEWVDPNVKLLSEALESAFAYRFAVADYKVRTVLPVVTASPGANMRAIARLLIRTQEVLNDPRLVPAEQAQLAVDGLGQAVPLLIREGAYDPNGKGEIGAALAYVRFSALLARAYRFDLVATVLGDARHILARYWGEREIAGALRAIDRSLDAARDPRLHEPERIAILEECAEVAKGLILHSRAYAFAGGGAIPRPHPVPGPGPVVPIPPTGPGPIVPFAPPTRSTVVHCASYAYAPVQCAVPGIILGAKVIRQHSDKDCERNRRPVRYAVTGNVLTVFDGCRADFLVTFR